jgi:hypothetical protein
LFLGAQDQVLQFRTELGLVPDDFQANAIAFHFVHFFLQVTGKKAHQHGNFFWRTPPIFGTESEQSEVRNVTSDT